MELQDPQENSLKSASSSYLRSARNQPVLWQQWGPEAFALAKRQNKPILLDIGAVWCHWCHVMDRESYENLDTAAVINDFFIPIKVDRDERPDVDSRYQAAVAAISGQSGWPLTAFLTPEGRPYFGGTYFPHEDRYGRPSFQRVLLMMADAFSSKREDVEETAASVMEAIEHNETFSAQTGKPGAELLQKIIESAISQFDERNGGFGSQPKFPNATALDLLIDAARNGNETAKHAATVSLKKMAAGGIYDQLAGGFHRYSVDEGWIVPHFEKMSYDNSELLKAYAHAFQTLRDPEFADVANDILRWMNESLSDRELGGFYASQDADASLEDDGDYFTWTRAEAEAVLTREEFFIAEAYFNLRAVGDMHHNPQKNVLHRVTTIESIARVLKLNLEVATELLASAKQKMYASRSQRNTPFIDKTIYTGWNAMCISAFIAAGRALSLKEPVDFALKSLDRVLAAVWDGKLLGHVIAYGDGVTPEHVVAAVLEDYAFLTNASLDAWEATGEIRYFEAAEGIADAMLARFLDVPPNETKSRGFFDTEHDPLALGALTARRKPLQDSPTPSGNSVAATVLLRLYTLNGYKLYETRALETLETFAGVVEHFGLYAASYGLALRRAVEPPVQICVLGSDALADELETAALVGYAVEKSVVRVRSLDTLPPAWKETLPNLPGVTGSVAVVCKQNVCLPPVASWSELKASIG